MQMISLYLFALVLVTFLLLAAGERFLHGGSALLYRKCVLLLAGAVFVSFAGWFPALLLLAVSLVCALCAFHTGLAAIGIAVLALVLTGFKLHSPLLPLGISFYTFNAISYLADVKRQSCEKKNVMDVMVYLSFFPRFTAGPLQRSADFFAALENERNISYNRVKDGLWMFAYGVFEKLVVADRISVFVGQVYRTPDAFGSATVMLAIAAYTVQLYFDFCGYSDMARGAALILGFPLPQNFDLPFVSKSISGFWRRWHITLGAWMRDYVFYPLLRSRVFGGMQNALKRRVGKRAAKWLVNAAAMLVLWFLVGFWHGAAWRYIIGVGLLHCCYILAGEAAGKLWRKRFPAKEGGMKAFADILRMCRTFVLVSFSFVLFRAPSLSQAARIVRRACSFAPGLEQPYVWCFAAFALLTLMHVMSFVRAKRKKEEELRAYLPLPDLRRFWNLVLFFVFCGLILAFAYTDGSPFIYGNY